MFLYLEGEEVKITDEGMLIPEVKLLYALDRRNSSKPYFKKCITYIYWAYKIDGEYRNILPSKRKKLAVEHAEGDLKHFNDDKKLQDVIKVYTRDQTSLNQRMYESIKKDMDDLLEMIQSIPFTKKIKIDVMVDIPLNADSTETTKKQIITTVEVDNSKEKFEAISRSEKLIDLEEKLKKKIIKEDQQKKRSQGRLFDDKKSNL
jgi:hypothetical protein